MLPLLELLRSCGDGRFAVQFTKTDVEVPNGRTNFGSVLAKEFGDGMMLGRDVA